MVNLILLGFIKIAALGCTLFFSVHFWYSNAMSYFEAHPATIYDFIVVGSGSAGSVIASRLSENENYSVLLLEEGGYPSLLGDIPLLSTILPLTPIAQNFLTEPQRGHGVNIDQKSIWPRGKVIGGSSVLNFMLYVRGNKHDYDHWASMGNEGWSFKELLPFFMKSENNVGTNIEEKYHGKFGSLKVEDRVWKSKLPQAFIDAGLLLGYNHVDINGENQTGFTIPQLTADGGARCSAYSAFLKKSRKRSNLKVVTYARVQRVLVDESKRAYGIQYTKHGHNFTVLAAREIVLSAGSIGSPQILMLSGIGPKDHLKQHKIEVVADKRVGDNLQDHVYVPLAPLVHNDSSASLVNPVNVFALWDYFIHGNGQYTSNGVDGMAFKASKYSERPDWPDVQLHFLSYSAASDKGVCVKQVLGMEDKAWRQLYKPFTNTDTASMFATLVRPKSRGIIRLRSVDPSHEPIIDPQYYSDPRDIRVMIEALKFAYETVNTSALGKYVKLHDSRHPYCHEFPTGTESYFECLIKYTSATLHHPVGTCKMGPSSDPQAVVDPQLRVHGIKGLRVADASVMPVIPNGNINAPVIMIGEKAADMILKHHKGLNYDSSLNLLKRTSEEVPLDVKDEF